jgi:hypothetical protein
MAGTSPAMEDIKMLQNYLITALRNFTRHKLYSFINIAGLTVGLTCAIFIILFVRDELSYDRWIPGTENLYRVEWTVLNQDQRGHPPRPAFRSCGRRSWRPNFRRSRLPAISSPIR